MNSKIQHYQIIKACILGLHRIITYGIDKSYLKISRQNKPYAKLLYNFVFKNKLNNITYELVISVYIYLFGDAQCPNTKTRCCIIVMKVHIVKVMIKIRNRYL